MEINIVKRQKAPKVHFDVFIVYTSWVFGDADGEGDSETIVKAEHKDKLPGFLMMLEKALLAHPDGKESRDGYDHVPGWEDYQHGVTRLNYPSGGYDGYIPFLECYSIAYYDQDGERHDVDVVFTTEEQDTVDQEMETVNKDNNR